MNDQMTESQLQHQLWQEFKAQCTSPDGLPSFEEYAVHEIARLRAERDEALRQNAEAAPLMDAYCDLVVAWHAYDKAQPAQGLFEQLETITNRVALNNAGVAFLKKHEALKAEWDALRAALEQVRTFLLKEDELYRDQMEKSAMPRGPLGDELLRMLDVTRAALDEGGA